jgi:hypothetical protein
VTSRGVGQGFLGLKDRTPPATKEISLSHATRYARQHAKARPRRRRNARSASRAIAAKRSRLPKPCITPWSRWAYRTPWCAKSPAAYGASRSGWGKSLGSCSRPSVAAARPRSGAGCGGGTSTGPHVGCTPCPNAPGASGGGVLAWRAWCPCGVLGQRKARRLHVAGSGPGPPRTRSATRMAPNGVAWGPGGAGSRLGGSRASMDSGWWSAWARARGSCRWPVPCGGLTPSERGRRAGTHGPGRGR